MIIADQWTEYKLLDAGDGEKVESWNGTILRRPDPQAIWPWTKPGVCDNVHAIIIEVRPRRAVGI